MNALNKGVPGLHQDAPLPGIQAARGPGSTLRFRFVSAKQGAPHITIPMAVQWAQRNPKAQPAEWARRLTCVRGFARFWIATDPGTEIPVWA